jgi:hypothetical protein
VQDKVVFSAAWSHGAFKFLVVAQRRVSLFNLCFRSRL